MITRKASALSRKNASRFSAAARQRQSGVRRRFAAAIVAAACLAVGGCAWLDTKQRQLALRPTPAKHPNFEGLRPGDMVFSRAVPSDAPVPDRVELWWLPQPDPAAPTLLYLHGTFRDLFFNLPKIDALREAGFAVVAVDYRGWGESTPIVPSEETISADARLAWREVERLQPDPRRRVIYGHSLGGAVAVDLASHLEAGRDYGALILESTFTSLPDVAAAAGFWGRIGAKLTTLRFDAKSKIGHVDAPILMLHGDADHTIPVDLGRQLRDAATGPVTWLEIAGGPHSELHSYAPIVYQRAMRDVIERIDAGSVASDPRRRGQPAGPAHGSGESSGATMR
jgi:pimeloyl-ACP methyl ester carboxylesterase